MNGNDKFHRIPRRLCGGEVHFWISKASDLLADGGIIAVAVPNFGSLFRIIMNEKESYICPPSHLNFFDPKTLSRLLEIRGFKVESVQWVSRMPKTAFEKRLPAFCKPIVPFMDVLSSPALKIIDVLRLGMIFNVYARKKG